MAATTTFESVVGDDRISSYGRLIEAQRTLHRIFDRSLRAKADISIVWFEALLRLGRSENRRLPINELGDAMQLTSGGATRLVDRLEEQGYLERVACPSDRRVSWAQLTAAGEAKLADATRTHLDDLQDHFVSKLSSDEMTQLTLILLRLQAAEETP